MLSSPVDLRLMEKQLWRSGLEVDALQPRWPGSVPMSILFTSWLLMRRTGRFCMLSHEGLRDLSIGNDSGGVALPSRHRFQ